jgi:hypothetical protein
MDEFLIDPQEHKTYKLSTHDGKTFIYWVSVFATKEGAFFHGRGRELVRDPQKVNSLKQKASQATEQDYINAMKDYFQIDKKVREEFIKHYKL